MKAKRRGLFWSALILLALTSPAAAQPPATVNVGLIGVAAANADLYIAQEMEFFKAERMGVNFTLFSRPVEALQALQTGAMQVIAVSPDHVILNRARGGTLTIVGAAMRVSSWAVVSARGITEARQLRGSTIGVTQIASSTARMVLKALEKWGNLSDKDVKLIESGAPQNRFAALQTGAIQATILIQPDDFRAAEQGFNVLGYVKEIIAVPGVVYVVDEKWAREHADLLVRFLRAVHKGQDYFYQPANRDSVIAVIAKATRVDRKYGEKVYDLYTREKMISTRGEFDVPSIQTVIDQQLELGLLKKPVPPLDSIVDLRYNRQASSPR